MPTVPHFTARKNQWRPAVPQQNVIVPHNNYSTQRTVHALCKCLYFHLFNAAKGYGNDNATGYASSGSSTPTGTPCYDNASLVTAEVLIRTATQSENI